MIYQIKNIKTSDFHVHPGGTDDELVSFFIVDDHRDKISFLIL